MIANVQSPASKFKRVGLVLAMASGVLGATSAWADPEIQSPPLGIYGGATLGVGASQWHCGTTCDRASFSGKLFGGKRLTPGLAAEINYMVFGGLNRANDTANAAATHIDSERQKFRAATVGINWEVELLQDFTNHIRLGWAFTKRVSDISYAGVTTRVKDYGGAPYIGAGLSFRLTEAIRLVNGFDYIVDGHDSFYLFSVGASAEF
jgi:hypothetical protein